MEINTLPTTTFPYRLSRTQFVTIIAIQLMMSAVFFYMAENGVEISSLIRLGLSSDAMPYIHWTFAGLFLLGALVTTLFVFGKGGRAIELVVDDIQITAPLASMTNKMVSIPYNRITGAGQTKIEGREFFIIESTLGRVMLLPTGFETPLSYRLFSIAVVSKLDRLRVTSN